MTAAAAPGRVIDWMILPLRRYTQFTGRARPKEYWLFFLFVVGVTLALTLAETMFGIGSGASWGGMTADGWNYYTQHNAGWLVGLFSLAVLLPSFAVAVRRLHDTDRSGWWLLVGLLPLIGAVVLFVFLVSGGTRGPNRFGEDPVAAPPLPY